MTVECLFNYNTDRTVEWLFNCLMAEIFNIWCTDSAVYSGDIDLHYIKEEKIMTKTYRLTGLCCANCAARMERLIEKIDTVEDVTLNFMTAKLIVEMDEKGVEATEEKIMAAIAKVSREVVMTRA